MLFSIRKSLCSPSSVSLFARHLLPFGRRLLCSCASQETWPFYLTIANSRSRQMRANISPWHADRRSAQGVRSTTEGEIFKGTDGACADPGTQNFPCHGVHPPAFQFYSSSFYVTHRFFVTFFPEESNVPFLPSPPLSFPYTRPTSAAFLQKGAVIHG